MSEGELLAAIADVKTSVDDLLQIVVEKEAVIERMKELLGDLWQQLFDRDSDSIDTRHLLDRIDWMLGRKTTDWSQY